ncbi:MAG: hypothetical protein AAFP90_19195, partial [Planctomycetota bacterium]
FRNRIITEHLRVLEGIQPEDSQRWDSMPPRQADYLRSQLLTLWTLTNPDGPPVPEQRINTALPRLRDATRHMGGAASQLQLGALQFCKQIMGFGNIQRFARDEFQPGQEVIVYCEVDNVVSVKDKNVFRTHLKGTYDIINGDGRTLMSLPLPEDIQELRSRVRDRFVGYLIPLPNDLKSGTYRLRITLEDMLGKKYGQSVNRFRVR